jgi:hypothetical protein
VWYDVPGRREVRDGPSNWKVVLAGETDTLVGGSEGVRGLYRCGPFADLVYRGPASVGPIGAPADRFAMITPDFLWTAGDGRHQLRLYLVEGSDRPQPRPVALSAGPP